MTDTERIAELEKQIAIHKGSLGRFNIAYSELKRALDDLEDEVKLIKGRLASPPQDKVV